jgi:hypothetical protein
MGFITAAALDDIAASMGGNAYGEYLKDVLRHGSA